MDKQPIFSEPVKSWQAIGILESETGHHFRLFVTGPRKEDVEHFVRQYESGDVVIRVRLEQVEAKPLLAAPFVSDAEPALPVHLMDMTWGNVSLGISRANENEFKDWPRPYRIVYEIDPWLSDSNSSSNVFEATFGSADDPTQVECNVTAGKVRAELAEWTIGINDYVIRNQNFAQESSGLFTLSGLKQSTGAWRVRLTRASLSPKFTLAYSKTIN